MSQLVLDNDKEAAFEYYTKNASLVLNLDLITGKFLLEKFVLLHKPDEGDVIFEKLLQTNIIPTIEMVNLLMSSWIQSNQMSKAERVLSLMVQCKISPNLGTYHVLLEGYLKSGELEKVENIIKIMTEENIQIDSQYFEAFLEKSVSIWPNHVLRIFGEIGSKKIPVTPKMLECILMHHLNHLDYEKLEKIFQRIKSAKFSPSESICCQIIQKMAPKDTKIALDWLKKIERSGVKMTQNIYQPLIQQYVRDSKAHSVEKLFGQMRDHGVNPDCNSYNILLNMYGQNFAKFKQIWLEMQNNGVIISETTRSLLLRVFDEFSTKQEMQNLHQTLQVPVVHERRVEKV